MGGSGAPVSARASVSAMREVIANLGAADSGRFLSTDGGEIPW